MTHGDWQTQGELVTKKGVILFGSRLISLGKATNLFNIVTYENSAVC